MNQSEGELSSIPKHILASSPSTSRLSAGPEPLDDIWNMDDTFDLGCTAVVDGLTVSPNSSKTAQEPMSVTRCCIKFTAPLCSNCLRCGRLTVPLLVFCMLCLIFLSLGRGYLTQLLSWLENLSITYSLIVFVVLFTIISFPFGFGYIILNMTAGYLYGLMRGQAVVTLSVAVGFSVAFILCRSCLRDWASQYLSSSPTLLAMKRVVEGPHGLKVIVLTRFTPIPFGLQNTLFAITEVTFIKVLIGSVLGLFPTQLLNTYMGSTVRNMKEVLADRADGYIILTVQIIFSIILSLYLVQKAKQELSKLARPLDVETGLGDDGR